MRGFLVPCSQDSVRPLSAASAAVELPELGRTTIGRSSNSSIVCADEAVSGQHCILFSLGSGRYELEDLSRNGTFWNDQLVGKGQRIALEPNGVLALSRVERPTCPRFRLKLDDGKGQGPAEEGKARGSEGPRGPWDEDHEDHGSGGFLDHRGTVAFHGPANAHEGSRHSSSYRNIV